MHRHWRIIAKAKRRSEEGARQKRRKERGFLAGGNLKFEIWKCTHTCCTSYVVCVVLRYNILSIVRYKSTYKSEVREAELSRHLPELSNNYICWSLQFFSIFISISLPHKAKRKGAQERFDLGSQIFSAGGLVAPTTEYTLQQIAAWS